MKKKFVPGSPKAGNRSERCGGKHETRDLLLDVSPLTLSPNRRIRGNSKKDPDRLILIRIVIAMLAAGQSINEEQTYKLSPSTRYHRGDCLKSLKIVARMFPTQTRLFLNGGLWTISPVSKGTVS